MAEALVTQITGSGKMADKTLGAIATVYFFGNDVPDNIEGQPYRLAITLESVVNVEGLTLKVNNAVKDYAAFLGLILASSDIYLPSYRLGAAPVQTINSVTIPGSFNWNGPFTAGLSWSIPGGVTTNT